MQSCPFTAAQRGDERHSPAVVAFGSDPSSSGEWPDSAKGVGVLLVEDAYPTGGGSGARSIRAGDSWTIRLVVKEETAGGSEHEIKAIPTAVVAATARTFRT